MLKLRTLFEGVVEHPNGQLEHFMEEQFSTVHIQENLESISAKKLHSHSALVLEKQPHHRVSFERSAKSSRSLLMVWMTSKSLEALLNVRVHKLREDVRSNLEPLTELSARSWPQRRNTVDS